MSSMNVVESVGLIVPAENGDIAASLVAIVARYIKERCDVRVLPDGQGELVIELAVDPNCGAECYRIEQTGDAGIRINGGDQLGLLYGVGKLLHTSHYTPDGYASSAWRGLSGPDCSMRGIYLATHFENFYEAAPVEEVQRYVEDLALWGVNSLLLHFPTHQYAGLDDPAARENLEQICKLMRIGRRLGLRVGLVQCVNQGWADAPQAIRAKPYPDDWGRRGTLGVNICSSDADGKRYLQTLYGDLFDSLADIGLDILCTWPYDEGGCGCNQCWPWGGRGYLNQSRDMADQARERYPELQVAVSTWMFDNPPAGEWDGLRKAVTTDGGWIDYIMADAHEDFPEYPLAEGVPGDLPLVNFPEISMWGAWPWGGYGATPLTQRFQRLWDQVSAVIAGGFPYSEGISEDINKIVCLGFQWQKDRPVEDILREYIGCEYSAEATDDLLAAIAILEQNHVRDIREDQPASLTEAEEAFAFIERAEQTLTPQVRDGWRWRILYLRALIDRELQRNGGLFKGAAMQEAFDELRRIYHANDRTSDSVCPPIVTES